MLDFRCLDAARFEHWCLGRLDAAPFDDTLLDSTVLLASMPLASRSLQYL